RQIKIVTTTSMTGRPAHERTRRRGHEALWLLESLIHQESTRGTLPLAAMSGREMNPVGSVNKGLCLVLGSSRGIGAAIALRLGRDGWDVIAHGRRTSDELLGVASKLANRYVTFDVSSHEGVKEGISHLLQNFGTPKAVVYCCGINRV